MASRQSGGWEAGGQAAWPEDGVVGVGGECAAAVSSGLEACLGLDAAHPVVGHDAQEHLLAHGLGLARQDHWQMPGTFEEAYLGLHAPALVIGVGGLLGGKALARQRGEQAHGLLI